MNSKQRAMLRGMANTMETILYIGKDGVVPGTIKQASDALEARELIKCAVQQGCPLTAREAVTELCAALEAEPVQCIGRRFVMYRPSKKSSPRCSPAHPPHTPPPASARSGSADARNRSRFRGF